MGSTSTRAAAVLAAALAVGALTIGAAPVAQSAEGFALTRVAGENRYATAAALAKAAFPSGSDVAVVASGENFPDALAGSFLAGRFGEGAPILLTQRDSLPAPTSAALDDLEASTVYVLGGTGAVSEAVATALATGGRTVTRIAGTNRYETAAEVASFEADGAADPGQVGGATTVIVASGEGFADALAAGPLAFQANLPIVLTPAGALDDAAAQAIDDLGAAEAWVVGGTSAVGPAVIAELESMDIDVTRIAGANRYATAVAVANRGRSDLGLSGTGVDLASGENFPDALAAGPASGAANRPLLLTARSLLSKDTEGYLTANSDTLTAGRVFGGTAAVSSLAVSQANAAGSTGAAGSGVTRLVAIRASEDEYDVVEEGTDEVVTIGYDTDDDDFTVDGQDAAVSAFEAAATPGDLVTVDDPEDPASHDLINVSAASFTTGIVGNVDIAGNQLDIIEPVSGAAFRRNVAYAGTFRVDGASATEAEFEADVNEGDAIEIAGGAFNLTNKTVTGDADDVEVIEASLPVVTQAETRFSIGELGDVAESPGDPGATPENDPDDDARYSASGTDEALTIDGAPATYAQFEAALNDGDGVSYSRKDGIETIAVINEPEEIDGEVSGGISADGSDLDVQDESNDGGSFTITSDDEELTIAYSASTVFRVDGKLVDEADFEDDVSVGDDVIIERNGSTIVSITLENEIL